MFHTDTARILPGAPHPTPARDRPGRGCPSRRACLIQAGVLVVLVGLLVAMGAIALPVEAGFTSTTTNAPAWSAATLPAPTGFTASRPCPASAPTLKGETSTTTSGTSATLSTPSAAAGDVLIAYITTSSAAGNASSSGWNTLGQVSGGGMALTALYLPLSGAPAATYTFNWSAGTGVVRLASYTGVDPYNPIATMNSTSNTSGSTTATSSTITAPRVPGRVALGVAVATAPTVSDPAGQTRRMSTATPDAAAGMTVWDGPVSSSGTTPAYAATWTGSHPWLMLPVYLQPPATAAKDPTVTLTWTASGSPAAGYTLARNDGSTFTVAGAATVSYSDTTTTAGTAYTYTLRTTVGSWTSSGSMTASVAACS